jgi:hypothetical protein
MKKKGGRTAVFVLREWKHSATPTTSTGSTRTSCTLLAGWHNIQRTEHTNMLAACNDYVTKNNVLLHLYVYVNLFSYFAEQKFRFGFGWYTVRILILLAAILCIIYRFNSLREWLPRYLTGTVTAVIFYIISHSLFMMISISFDTVVYFYQAAVRNFDKLLILNKIVKKKKKRNTITHHSKNPENMFFARFSYLKIESKLMRFSCCLCIPPISV